MFSLLKKYSYNFQSATHTTAPSIIGKVLASGFEKLQEPKGGEDVEIFDLHGMHHLS